MMESYLYALSLFGFATTVYLVWFAVSMTLEREIKKEPWRTIIRLSPIFLALILGFLVGYYIKVTELSYYIHILIIIIAIQIISALTGIWVFYEVIIRHVERGDITIIENKK